MGIAGFGGLGHMGLKYALAMGAEVSVIGRSNAKREMALSMGAKHYYSDVKDAKGANLDLIISTIPTPTTWQTTWMCLPMGVSFCHCGLAPKGQPHHPQCR
ncbi:hypothetical protein NHP190003_10530 [Helicobacter sp. NHP19-003]|uniref:Alcohol dehydrogenase-like C-terminal domain-containing protein n=1 Tax=Helicobacter gastrocanis TaxID=2849641 RepID=A0ABM7SAW2_9HELI|nr:zinc-binding dehydrogenase [Helicobacter sp. NHP19-003]BCZ17771.1 hypothetical protein NHP190003_10530 [Helicobacter sp. NHP19-003]